MSTYVLTSMFSNGFDKEVTERFQQLITKRDKFAFVASEFEKVPEKTDEYLHFFLKMFEENDIHFKKAYVVDGRMTAEEAQRAVEEADVVWLSGGDTPVQYSYLKKYGLVTVIRQHSGVIIGMSAGTINMAQTAICTLSCGHESQEIYEGLGCVKISVEPHFTLEKITDELLELSNRYEIYGLCDESIIVCTDEKMECYGKIYRIRNGEIDEVKTGEIE